MRTRLLGKLAYCCKLVYPLPVIGFRDTDGWYVVHDERKYNYGTGLTKGEALLAFKHILADDFLWLKKQEAILHPSLRSELQYLQQFVRRY